MNAMTNGTRSISLALIHNNDASRNARIRPALNDLKTSLSQRYSANLIEVSAQPDVRPHGLPMAILRDGIYEMLDRRWRRYRRLPVQLLPLHVGRFISGSLKKCFRSTTSWKRNSCIQMFVTDKHIRAWNAFLEKGGDCLICFEDDAVFRNDSVDRLMALLDELSASRLDGPVYADLAGGLSLEVLNIQNLQESWDGSFRHYSKPVTNTACAYLLSKPLVAKFCEIITRRRWVRLIGIDWMMNELLMELDADGVKCVCIHADPTIFKHGTTTGDYVSWQADPQVQRASK